LESVILGELKNRLLILYKMGKTVITVEHLSKRYILKHKKQERYTALRDVLTDKARTFFKKRQVGDFKEREEFLALSDISFEVKQGDRIGIIGKNGAGKSTLLKILSRIVSPTKGQIVIEGRVASLLEVGTGFHPELTGRENIFLNGSVLGMTKTEIKRKFDEIVAFSEVEKFLDTPVKRYSSGMYVRLAFSVAAHLEPEILIVDEVLAVGDADFQKKCLGKMRDVTGEGRTVLFVSHNMGAINTLCTSAILLDKGTIQAMGDTEKITGIYFSGDMFGSGEFIIGKNNSNEKVVIEKITLKDGNGSIRSNFQFGSNIEVEVELNSLSEIEEPYIWIAIKSARGPITNASGLIDGYRPAKFTKGKNIIKCTFFNVPLLPDQYTIHMGIRDSGGSTSITDTKDVAVFSIVTVLSEVGLNPVLADTLAGDSVSPIIPYQWEFNDGKKYIFNVKNYVK
jgi:lipopolysaccharide transport system ATP-binding protein